MTLQLLSKDDLKQRITAMNRYQDPHIKFNRYQQTYRRDIYKDDFVSPLEIKLHEAQNWDEIVSLTKEETT